MAAIQCEMCGSQDLIKQDGLFVCQHCGMKYSVEDAKKMMIEGTVDVKGTVKVDNTAFVEKYLANARRAKQKEDWEETEKYYNMVEQNDPTNIEAIFYSAYGKAKSSLVVGDLYKRQAVFKVLQNCVSIIDDNFDVEKESQLQSVVKEIHNDIFKMFSSDYVYNYKNNEYGRTVYSDQNKTIALFGRLSLEFCTTLFNIAAKIPEDEIKKRLPYYSWAESQALIVESKCVDYTSEMHDLREKAREIVENCHKKMDEIDPAHETPWNPPRQNSTGKKGGCYVATAIYGSYNCPQVWVLRRYRDNTLAKSWYGRAFIHSYYAISPRLVKWFGKTEWFKNMWKPKLDSMIEKLRADGVKDTPYEDRTW